jgi:hypothetical protein
LEVLAKVQFGAKFALLQSPLYHLCKIFSTGMKKNMFLAKRLFDEIVFNSWWVILFMLFCYMLYEHGMRARNKDFAKLNEHLSELKALKEKSLKTQEEYLLQINSQSDPAWVELTLMKGLGLVPEGQTKVYFFKKTNKE